MPPSSPVSPCINVCVLDADGMCQGCFRTIDEIAGWGRMSAVEQWGVVSRIERRRTPVGAVAAAPTGGSSEF